MLLVPARQKERDAGAGEYGGYDVDCHACPVYLLHFITLQGRKSGDFSPLQGFSGRALGP